MVSLLTLMALKSSSDSERPLGVIIVFSIKKTVTEEQQSLKGSWKIPPCRRPDQFAQSFGSDEDSCARSFHEKFAKTKSGSALSSKFNQ